MREIEDRERRRSGAGFVSATRKLVANISGSAILRYANALHAAMTGK